MAAVVSCFLLGLGLGARICAVWVDRLARPLRAYAILELAIGALALAVPYELELLAGASSSVHRALS